MLPKHAHSMGGQKTALIFRKKALDEYYKNPKICKNCGNIIDVKENQKVAEVRKKNFCNHSCSAIFSNSKRKKIEKVKTEKLIKLPKWSWIITKTKNEIFTKSKNWQSARNSIRKHANFIYESEINDKKCYKCGYTKHIEVCHIKSVSSFEGNTLITDINDKNNLIGLCPNCHWEYDQGLLKI